LGTARSVDGHRFEPSAQAGAYRRRPGRVLAGLGLLRRRVARCPRAGGPADGLTHSQFRLWCAVAESPHGRCGQLAEQVGVTAPTVTRMLSGLEAAGFVTRAPSAEDRRGVCVQLTAAGRAALRAKQE